MTKDGSSSILTPPAEETQALEALSRGLPSDPFAWLGPHRKGDGWVVRIIANTARRVSVISASGATLAVAKAHPSIPGIFEAELADEPRDYRLHLEWPSNIQTIPDAYAYGPLLDEQDLAAFRDGKLQRPADMLGAMPMRLGGIDGVRFALWAPNASRVSVVGSFNAWDGRRHPMRLRHSAGVWEIFVPGIGPGARYKFEMLDRHNHLLPLKADPFARQTEPPPASASVVPSAEPFSWHDTHWIARRGSSSKDSDPISIYEVHTTSWWRNPDNTALDWDGLAARLIPYVQHLGFTHIELLPITEYPFGGSWGYQPIGMYAPTARLGAPEAFARFVDSCHVAGIGVIVDWVSAHFPSDEHGLRDFDGTALYEHADPREGFHQDWNTLIYNYGRNEVRNFLIGSALEWIERFHIDGLRVDAVASMIYRDYSRPEGEWIPNAHGGRENLEAVAFLRQLNETVRRQVPGVMVIAEESTAWPGVTAPVGEGGLGFSEKWNMGWMHDTLSYMQREPIHRRHHHGELTFGTVYAHSERFILPLSHDEVVHGKGSLLSRMPGDAWQRFANLRAYLAFMWAHPGKKLLFMGGEFAQWREWDHDNALDWFLLDQPLHQGMQNLVGDLNRLLQEEPALHRDDLRERGFAWVIGDDARHSVYAFLRCAEDASMAPVLAVSNFTPIARHDYRIGVPVAGQWREICNTDSGHYGGSNLGNGGIVFTEPESSHGHGQSLRLTLPPLATLLLRPDLA
jgi:1,4-alpha-glucan branching enzyme